MFAAVELSWNTHASQGQILASAGPKSLTPLKLSPSVRQPSGEGKIRIRILGDEWGAGCRCTFVYSAECQLTHPAPLR